MIALVSIMAEQGSLSITLMAGILPDWALRLNVLDSNFAEIFVYRETGRRMKEDLSILTAISRLRIIMLKPYKTQPADRH